MEFTKATAKQIYRRKQEKGRVENMAEAQRKERERAREFREREREKGVCGRAKREKFKNATVEQGLYMGCNLSCMRVLTNIAC